MVDRSADLSHDWHHDGRLTRFVWMGDAEVDIGRVYALAFTSDDRILLVAIPNDPPNAGPWLPGGGVQDGESTEDALARELYEEAGATIHDLEPLGAQRVEDDLWGLHHQAFYWCRISLEEDFIPQHEVTEYLLVPPNAFLDTLVWGRQDPKGAMLLERSIAINAARPKRELR